MRYGLKTHEITVNTGDGQHTVKGIVTVNTTGENTSEFDNMTEVDSLTIHVTTPATPPEIVGGELEYNGNPYRVTSIKPPIDPENRVMFNPFKWSFNAKQVQY
nr:MAG: hypothetical protein [Bacteriophage sp.]